ncbi:MAG: hypothetical protein ABI454_11935 [Sphingomicrobium sp.]
MMAFTKLELAALHSMFSERPKAAPQLERQLSVATVVERENTGVGFFTTISVPPDAAAIDASEPLTGETHARVPGLEYEMGFVLFFDHGRMATLEGFTCEGSTTSLDLTNLTFEIIKLPVNRAS